MYPLKNIEKIECSKYSAARFFSTENYNYWSISLFTVQGKHVLRSSCRNIEWKQLVLQSCEKKCNHRLNYLGKKITNFLRDLYDKQTAPDITVYFRCDIKYKRYKRLVSYWRAGQRSADKMAAYFFAIEEIVVNLSLVFCSVWYIISV